MAADPILGGKIPFDTFKNGKNSFNPKNGTTLVASSSTSSSRGKRNVYNCKIGTIVSFYVTCPRQVEDMRFSFTQSEIIFAQKYYNLYLKNFTFLKITCLNFLRLQLLPQRAISLIDTRMRETRLWLSGSIDTKY
jgi:hypothetical protein